MPVQQAETLADIEEAYAHSHRDHVERTDLIGEETLTKFNSNIWLAVQVGDILEGHYKVLGKVANGGSSTIWFVHDEEAKTHWILKISINYTSGHAREEEAFDIIAKLAGTTHPGRACLLVPTERFTISRPRSGRHHCFLMPPSACHVEEAWLLLGEMPLALIREILGNTLQALDFLHTECKLIHTDIKLDNILFAFSGESVMARYHEELEKNPEKCKIHRGKEGDEYPVTKAKPFVLTKNSFAFPQLNDLGESVPIPPINKGFASYRKCSPKAFRAPEVILERPFNASIDVWMVGCMTLQMLTGKVPILPPGPNLSWDKEYTLAQHHALLGPPPKAFITQTANTLKYWNEEGEWIYTRFAVPDISLESMLAVVEDDGTRACALAFVRSCLQWLPQDRSPARALVRHPFITGQENQPGIWRALESWEDEEDRAAAASRRETGLSYGPVGEHGMQKRPTLLTCLRRKPFSLTHWKRKLSRTFSGEQRRAEK